MTFLLRKLYLISLIPLLALEVGAEAAVPDGPATGIAAISNQPQLFLDNHLVAKMTNLTRHLRQPSKHSANPLIVGKHPWETRFVSMYGTVLYDNQANRFRAWYLANATKDGIPDTPGYPRTAEYYTCYAESENGIDWTKPMVGRGKFGLHEKHNVVIQPTHGFCVLPAFDAAEPSIRFRGAGGRAFGSSSDGIQWRLSDWNAVGKNDTGTSVVRWQDEYLAYVRYQVDDPDWPAVMRGVGLSVSEDFKRWTPKELIIKTDQRDGYPWSQPYGLSVTRYGDLLIGVIWFLHLDQTPGNNSLGDQDMQLMVSRDGRNWSRVADRATFLEGTPGDWDQGRVWPSTTLLLKDDRVYLYYSGCDTRHGTGWGKTGIGLATLPADRFVAIRQEDESGEGILVTRPLRVSGNRLLVNAELPNGGSDLQVELLDAQCNMLPGFGRQQSRLAAHDGLRYRVTWEDEGRTRTLKDALAVSPSVVLRFVVQGGSFYAFQVDSAFASIPRSDGTILHADLENYTDGVVQALNAGVRWLGDPFSNRKEGTVEVTRGFAFSGARSAHIHSKGVDEIARVRFQRRFDAPTVAGDSVSEVVFRPVRKEYVDMKEVTVWSARSMSGHAVGLKIVANGDARSGTFQLDLLHGSETEEEQRSETAVSQLKQTEWIRIIQHRRRKERVVDLWVGTLGQEARIGTWPDLSAKRQLARVEVGDTSEDRSVGSGYWDDIRLGGRLRPEQRVAPPEPPLRDVGQELPLVETPVVVGQSKQLLIDDKTIESSAGLTRTLHPVRKHPGNPLIVAEHPWEGQCVLLYGGVVLDPDSNKFRMWYLAWGKQIDQPSFICYMESEDGLRWTKPELGLVEFRGSKQNNIVLPGWSQTTIHYDPHDPDPARRYKGLLRLNGTRAFLSPDGLHWRDMGVVLEQAYDGTTAHWDPVDKKWIAMVKIFRDGKRARGYAESKDFLNWTDTYSMATVDERDAAGDQIYALYMFHYETAYFGLLRMYHTASDIVDIQLATSRNAKHWERELRTPFIPTSPTKGEWDYANNSVPSTPPIRVSDELWFFYSGRSVLHNVVPNDGAIGLGTLRLDGFISMDANDPGGVLTTRPLAIQGEALMVNVDAAGGELCAEVIGPDGQVIEPFSLTNCVPITTDSVKSPLRWRGAAEIGALKGHTPRLRFHLRNASLYAFWSE